MKKLNQKTDEVTVVIEVSFKENFSEVKKYIREEQCPLFFNFITLFMLGICNQYLHQNYINQKNLIISVNIYLSFIIFFLALFFFLP